MIIAILEALGLLASLLTLSIATRSFAKTSRVRRAALLSLVALLSVHDAGTGMDETVRSRLFTPFFTTKGQLGSGLGLHVVQSVVEEHCGELSVESAPASGSTFRLCLPLAKRAS